MEIEPVTSLTSGSELKVSNTASNIAQPAVTKSGTGRGGSRGGQF